MSRNLFQLAWLVAVACFLAETATAATFSAPEKITDTAAKYQLSRTANSIMALDCSGRLHLTYWSGRIVTNPANPSYIYYRTWKPGEEWTAQVTIDESMVDGDHVGGRHPSLTLTPEGGVWVVWQDHRHCTPAGNWIDNTELYGDFKPTGASSFINGDIRLTATSALHTGDNGYTPKIALDAEGRLSLLWYDYHSNQGISDLYIKTSNTAGVFDLGESIDSMRVTVASERGNTPPFTVPDLALDAAGSRHAVWAAGEGSGVDMYYGVFALDGGSTVTLLRPGATDFFDPPHTAIAPSGDLWIACADLSVQSGPKLVLLRRGEGETGFDAPRTVTTPGITRFPDLKIDDQGKVHLVWVDERAGTKVYYGVYDPDLETLTEEVDLGVSSGSWVRPSLVLDPGGNADIVFEKSVGLPAGEIWFTSSRTAAIEHCPLGARQWSSYP